MAVVSTVETRQRAFRRAFAILVTLVVAAFVVPTALANTPVNGAGFTTVNESVDGAGHCQNGNPNVNCNIYDGKQYVWLNGGPAPAYVGDGDYFFAVLEPGGQADPNDGAAKNLSDDYDAYTNRTFSVAGGAVTYGGTHDLDGNKIRLLPYADTSNPGGVYIMAICSLADGYPVDPSDCKYDAFKIQESEIENGLPLTVTKDAAGAYATTWAWAISKAADKTTVKQVGGTATFTYTVTVTHDGGTNSGVQVSGTISVVNPNTGDTVNGVEVTDQLSDGTQCSVTGGTDATLSAFQTSLPYSCTLPQLPASLDNTVTATWPDQFLDDGSFLAAGSADFTFAGISFAQTKVDDSVAVSDSFAGPLGMLTSDSPSPTSFAYSREIAIPRYDCQSYGNTATFTTNTTGSTGSASQTVRVCGPAKTGALTIGFWQNKNGQAIVTGGSATAGVCNSGTWLRQYAPYQDLSATATCSQVFSYVTSVIKTANASGVAMNAMLKAQMLATALDTYFSDPALGGNKINARAPLGGIAIDLTLIRTAIGAYVDSSSAFGGSSSMTVSGLLAYAASQSSAGGSPWYGNVKSVQELAKDAFDAINNEWAFTA